MMLELRFEFGQKVLIDGDKSIVARVTAVQIRKEYENVEVSWMHNGDSKSAWIENWRLEAAE